MWVTPSPESMTVPVNVRSPTGLLTHDAASAKTACTAMYKPVQGILFSVADNWEDGHAT